MNVPVKCCTLVPRKARLSVSQWVSTPLHSSTNSCQTGSTGTGILVVKNKSLGRDDWRTTTLRSTLRSTIRHHKLARPVSQEGSGIEVRFGPFSNAPHVRVLIEQEEEEEAQSKALAMITEKMRIKSVTAAEGEGEGGGVRRKNSGRKSPSAITQSLKSPVLTHTPPSGETEESLL